MISFKPSIACGFTLTALHIVLYFIIVYCRFVMEEKSPYARPLLKSNATFRYGMEYDEDYEFINNDPSKPAADHIKDENLSVKQLKMRYQGI